MLYMSLLLQLLLVLLLLLALRRMFADDDDDCSALEIVLEVAWAFLILWVLFP